MAGGNRVFVPVVACFAFLLLVLSAVVFADGIGQVSNEGQNYSFRTEPYYPLAGQQVKIVFVAEEDFPDYDALGEFSQPSVNGNAIEVLATKSRNDCVREMGSASMENGSSQNTGKSEAAMTTGGINAVVPTDSNAFTFTVGSNDKKNRSYKADAGILLAGDYTFSLKIRKGWKNCSGELTVESEQTISFSFIVNEPSKTTVSAPTPGTGYQITRGVLPDAGTVNPPSNGISTATQIEIVGQPSIVPPETYHATPAGPVNYAEPTAPATSKEGTAQPSPELDGKIKLARKLAKERYEQLRERVKQARGANQGGGTMVITVSVESGQGSGGGTGEPSAGEGAPAPQPAPSAGEAMPSQSSQATGEEGIGLSTDQALPQLPAMATCIGEECGIVKNIKISREAGIAVQADSFSVSSKESEDLKELTVEVPVGNEKTVVRAAAGKETSFTSGGISATTNEEVELKDNRLSVGGNPLGITPSKAAQKAVEASAGATVESISIKVEGRPLYIVEAKKQAKLFWLIPAEVRTTAKIDVQTGGIVSVEKPWWSFLATGE